MKGYKRKKGLIISDRPASLGNYVKRMIDAAQEAQPGTVSHTVIKHDDWCLIFSGKPCNCNPDIEIISDEEYQKRQP